MYYKIVLFLAFVTFCYAQSPAVADEPIAILRFENDGPNPDGSYKFSYETANGITAEEEGHLKDAGTENEATEVRGSYKYTAPDGTLVSVIYIANEDGFQPQGTHISAAGVAPSLQQRVVQAQTVEGTAATAAHSSETPVVTSELPQTSQAAAAVQEEASASSSGKESVNGNGKKSVNGNGDEAANEAEASLFRPVYRARGGNNYYNRGTYQSSLF